MRGVTSVLARPQENVFAHAPKNTKRCSMPKMTIDKTKFRADVLQWYDVHRRTLPWRAPVGATAEPYAVWLSEIMLQQTTVATVGPYYTDFMAKWPTVNDLARASLDDVLVAWQGLGYYARARNLHKCAGVVAADYDGVFPRSESELRKLPGIGPYTAAAVAAIAFDLPAVPVDGNIERVTARVFAIDAPLPGAKPIISDAASGFVDPHRPGDFAQAMMDLGATVCTPSSPKCSICPVVGRCQGQISGIADRLPVKAAKKKRPERCAVVYWLTTPSGKVLLRKRPENGLLGGMSEFPSTPWIEGGWPSAAEIQNLAPTTAEWTHLSGEAVHVFTHFRLSLRVVTATVAEEQIDGMWALPEEFGEYALPTVMKKIVRLVMD